MASTCLWTASILVLSSSPDGAARFDASLLLGSFREWVLSSTLQLKQLIFQFHLL